MDKSQMKVYLNKRKDNIQIIYTANDFKSQYGKRVHDCVGLIKDYLWSDTIRSVSKYNNRAKLYENL